MSDTLITTGGNPICSRCGVTHGLGHNCNPLPTIPYEQSDAYWLRVYTGQALNGILARKSQHAGDGVLFPISLPCEDSVKYATALLAAVKSTEITS